MVSSKKKDPAELKWYYHYTTPKNAKQIEKDKKIKASRSDGNDAAFGEGVYLTDLDPSWGKTQLLKNNWVGLGVSTSRLKAHVKIKIPVNEVNKAPNTERNVFVYKGDINLDDYEHEINYTV